MSIETEDKIDLETIFFLIGHRVHLKYRERIETSSKETIVFFDNLAPLINKKQPIYQFTLETWMFMRDENIVVPDNDLKFISINLKYK